MFYVSVCVYELRLVNKTSYIITVGLSFGLDGKNNPCHKYDVDVIKHKVSDRRWDMTTKGPCLMRLLVLGKIRMSQNSH